MGGGGLGGRGGSRTAPTLNQDVPGWEGSPSFKPDSVIPAIMSRERAKLS